MDEETRVRIGVKQSSKGYIQMDITAEAPTVEKASELLDGAIKKLFEVARNNNLEVAK